MWSRALPSSTKTVAKAAQLTKSEGRNSVNGHLLYVTPVGAMLGINT